MRIASNNMIANAAGAGGNMDGLRRSGGRNARRANIIQDRVIEQQRELQIREKENERITALRERMHKIGGNMEMDFEIRRLKISSLSDQILKIYENRTRREEVAAEREMMRQKAVIEETTSFREDSPEQDEIGRDPEKAEELAQRENIRGLTRIAVSMDTIHTLRQTRASMASEAGQLRRDMESENSNYVKIGIVAADSTVVDIIKSEQSGFGNPSDFRNRQLNRLNHGISRLDAAINSAVSSMYRESSRMQESELAHHNERDEEYRENETDGVYGVDLLL